MLFCKLAEFPAESKALIPQGLRAEGFSCFFFGSENHKSQPFVASASAEKEWSNPVLKARLRGTPNFHDPDPFQFSRCHMRGRMNNGLRWAHTFCERVVGWRHLLQSILAFRARSSTVGHLRPSCGGSPWFFQYLWFHARSQPAECLDVFLSHTWLTPGRWKVLSLMLQLGWRPMLVIWLLMMAVLPVMVKNELLPMPFITEQASLDFEGECPWFPWLLMSGALALILGMLMVPYIPGQRTMCFLDVACIHQVDPDLMKRGIYGLGGFLKLSKDLDQSWVQIMTPPALERQFRCFRIPT